MSKSDDYLKSKLGPPKVTPSMAKSVSQYRRDLLEQQVENGDFSDGSSRNNKLSPASNVVAAITKKGQVASGGGGYKGSNDAPKQLPDQYSPLWLMSNMSMPRDKTTINAWSRAFYALNPYVHNAINLHSTYPISKLNIKCHNKEIERFFNDMAEELDLVNICIQIAQEYWLLGEAFPYAELDESTGKWSRIVLQNPDYITIKRTMVDNEPLIMLRPDDNLKRIVTSNKSSDIEQRKQLNPYIVDCVRKGQNIPLDNFYVSMIARKIAPYETRGTGLVVPIFKTLMLYDKIRESKYVQADDMINPFMVFKVGGGDGGYKANPNDLQAWRNIIEEMTYDKNFKLITHEGVDISVVGKGSGIYDTNNDVDRLVKEIFMGLMVPSAVMDGGGDTTYANAGVVLDVLRQRYMTFRNILSSWLKRKIFMPIAKIQDFYEFKDGKQVLIIPEIDWNHMSLFDTGEYIQTLKELTQGAEGEKRAAVHELHRALGLDFEDQMRKIRKETIANTILLKEKEVLASMTLNELRALTDDDEIQEKKDGTKEKLPGQTEDGNLEGGMPGMPGAPPMDLPDLGGGPPPEAPPAEPPK